MNKTTKKKNTKQSKKLANDFFSDSEMDIDFIKEIRKEWETGEVLGESIDEIIYDIDSDTENY